jgi:hypothetical protein
VEENKKKRKDQGKQRREERGQKGRGRPRNEGTDKRSK